MDLHTVGGRSESWNSCNLLLFDERNRCECECACFDLC